MCMQSPKSDNWYKYCWIATCNIIIIIIFIYSQKLPNIVADFIDYRWDTKINNHAFIVGILFFTLLVLTTIVVLIMLVPLIIAAAVIIKWRQMNSE